MIWIFSSAVNNQILSNQWTSQWIASDVWLHAWKKKKDLNQRWFRRYIQIILVCFDPCTASDFLGFDIGKHKAYLQLKPVWTSFLWLSAYLEQFTFFWCNKNRPSGAPARMRHTRWFDSSPTVFLNPGPVMDGVLWGWSNTSHSVSESLLPTFGREWG